MKMEMKNDVYRCRKRKNLKKIGSEIYKLRCLNDGKYELTKSIRI